MSLQSQPQQCKWWSLIAKYLLYMLFIYIGEFRNPIVSSGFHYENSHVAVRNSGQPNRENAQF
jgi:hypothetical protein